MPIDSTVARPPSDQEPGFNQTAGMQADIGLLFTVFIYTDLFVKCPDGRVISAPDFGPRGPGIESCWRWNSTRDLMALHLQEPFIITLPLS